MRSVKVCTTLICSFIASRHKSVKSVEGHCSIVALDQQMGQQSRKKIILVMGKFGVHHLGGQCNIVVSYVPFGKNVTYLKI